MMPNDAHDLPLMNALPRGVVPNDRPLVLASGSPRRSQLLSAAGYSFIVDKPDDSVETGVGSRGTAPEMVARLAVLKAADVVPRHPQSFVLAADTLASCLGQILGKPTDRNHAEQMLRLLSGRRHSVFTGICLWDTQTGRRIVDVSETELRMASLTEATIADYLNSMRWEGKAGGFGYQDGNDWIMVLDGGSESNVVGLPMERLAELLDRFDELSELQIGIDL
jgi:septum formation protein